MTTESNTKLIDWEEVAKHNTEEDIWIVIEDSVYDVSKYSLEHPGGPIVLAQKAGKNATTAFEQASHSKNAIDIVMPRHKVGVINKDSLIADWQKEAPSSTPSILVTVVLLLAVISIIYFLANN